MLIGSHVHGDDPLADAAADGADVVQFFLGNPQSWKKPKPREDAEVLKASSMPLYVHAPYLINVASANNRVRIPSRKILQDTCDAASEINATAVIVHGGHADDNDWEAGFDRWRKALEYLTAGGKIVWVVEPAARLVMILTPPSQIRILGPEDTIEGWEALPGFSCKVAELFE